LKVVTGHTYVYIAMRMFEGFAGIWIVFVYEFILKIITGY